MELNIGWLRRPQIMEVNSKEYQYIFCLAKDGIPRQKLKFKDKYIYCSKCKTKVLIEPKESLKIEKAIDKLKRLR